jgi:hypothetical protein
MTKKYFPVIDDVQTVNEPVLDQQQQAQPQRQDQTQQQEQEPPAPSPPGPISKILLTLLREQDKKVDNRHQPNDRIEINLRLDDCVKRLGIPADDAFKIIETSEAIELEQDDMDEDEVDEGITIYPSIHITKG